LSPNRPHPSIAPRRSATTALDCKRNFIDDPDVATAATDSVRRYIATQEAHHRKHSFIDELRELLNAAGIEFDEKYLL
jgi:hypothetical protein